MQYIKFKIQNFKGINTLELDLANYPSCDIFTLVGINESGKTTILEAIDFFQRDVLPDSEKHKLIPKSKKRNFNGRVSVKATIALEEDDEEAIKDFAESINFKITQPIGDIKVEKNYQFSDSKYKKDESQSRWTIDLAGLKPRSRKKRTLTAKDQEWQEIAEFIKANLFPAIIYYPNFLFEFPERIYLEDIKELALKNKEKQPFYKEVIQDILDSLDENLNINDHIVRRIKSSDEEDKEALSAVIETMSGKVDQVVLKAWNQLFDSSGKEIVLSCGLEKVDISDGESTEISYIEMGLKEGREKYAIKERSLGFRWFFSFLLLTEFRKQRQVEKGKTLFMLDEPASNLHSTAQKKLLSTFGDLVSPDENESGNCQLIYTTHSHHLINPQWLAGTHIVRNKTLNIEKAITFDSSKTDIDVCLYRTFVGNHPNQKTYFQPILDAVDYQPSLLEDVPHIFILEGKNDYYILKYFQEVILKSNSKLNFYPGGGADKNSPIIALYLAWGRDFNILLDADKAGEKAKKSYLKEFGGILDESINSLNDVNKKWAGFSTEQLFSEKDQIKITKKFDPNLEKFEKSKFNAEIQDLYIRREKISFEEKTKNNFKTLFKFLEKILKQKE